MEHILDLQVDYKTKTGVNNLIRALFALPFLPSSEIRPEFERLSLRAADQPRLCAFLSYMRTTWIEFPLWTPESWSVYRYQVRTNNHIEGWHNRLR